MKRRALSRTPFRCWVSPVASHPTWTPTPKGDQQIGLMMTAFRIGHVCHCCRVGPIIAGREGHNAPPLAFRMHAPVCRRQKAAHAAFEEQEIARLRQVRPTLPSRRPDSWQSPGSFHVVLDAVLAGDAVFVLPYIDQNLCRRSQECAPHSTRCRMLPLFACQY